MGDTLLRNLLKFEPAFFAALPTAPSTCWRKDFWDAGLDLDVALGAGLVEAFFFFGAPLPLGI